MVRFCDDTNLFFQDTSLKPNVTVTRPRNATDVGICLLRYASGIAAMSECQLNTKSFESDGHRSALSRCPHFTYNEAAVMKLRQECLQLVCRVSEKYCNVRLDPTECSTFVDTNEESCKCCSKTTFLPESMTSHGQRIVSDCSSDEGSIISDDSGSVYSPEDHNIELDESYDDTSSSSNLDNNESDNDSSVEEVRNNFDTEESMSLSHRVIHEQVNVSRDDIDNLICPGDMVEFRDNIVNSVIKRDSIVTIENSKICTYIVLKSGDILHPTKHAIRKVKVYCSATQTHIPNPLGQWFRVDKCLMQNGSLNSEQHIESETSDSDSYNDEQIK